MESSSSGLSWGWDWDQPADAWTGSLGLASSIWVRWCWGPSEGDSCGVTSGMGVMVPGVSSHSSAEPSARKRVRPRGNMGSSPGPLPHQT